MSEFIVGKINQLITKEHGKRIEGLEADLVSAISWRDAFQKEAEEAKQRIADLERQLAEAKAEIEAMRPDVERYRWLRSNDQAPSITGIWYGDFTLDKAIDDARKQP